MIRSHSVSLLTITPECHVTSLLQTQYGNPMIYVTENGVSEKMQCTDLCDDWRMKYFKDYINEMLKGEFICFMFESLSVFD